MDNEAAICDQLYGDLNLVPVVGSGECHDLCEFYEQLDKATTANGAVTDPLHALSEVTLRGGLLRCSELFVDDDHALMRNLTYALAKRWVRHPVYFYHPRLECGVPQVDERINCLCDDITRESGRQVVGGAIVYLYNEQCKVRQLNIDYARLRNDNCALAVVHLGWPRAHGWVVCGDDQVQETKTRRGTVYYVDEVRLKRMEWVMPTNTNVCMTETMILLLYLAQR